MVNCVVKSWDGGDAGQAEFDLKVAREETASHVVHRALIRQMANARQGTASSKTRSEVRGGGRKPWRQKGTGRARAGSIRSPLWRGGGVIFGPKPRDYSTKMNKKERRLALATAFQSRSEELVVVEDFADQLEKPKTKDLLAALKRWGVEADNKVLLVLAERNEKIYLSSRNVPNLKVLIADQMNVYDVLHADQVVATKSAISRVQEVYGVA
ncbi:MAG: 50S ribosomal protein L4 [Cyanobacteria bacterium P01_F01_bin.153]